MGAMPVSARERETSGSGNPPAPDGELVRIGELARRAGVPPATLRAWERRYGIVEPKRTDGGYRLYSSDDERRLREMLELITRGLAPAEAAGRVTERSRRNASPRATPPPALTPEDGDRAARLRSGLLDALAAYDEIAAHDVLDEAIAAFSVDALAWEVVLPVLRETGERWHRGDITVAEEHFASNVVRGRVMSLARGWGGGDGRSLVLACPEDEAHDLGLICFGLMLRARGWRITYLGADTPFESIATAVRRSGAVAVVLAVTSPDVDARLRTEEPPDLGVPLLLGGERSDEALADRFGGELLDKDMIRAADWTGTRFR